MSSLVLSLEEVVIEGARPEDAARLRALIEAVAADLGRRIAEAGGGPLRLPALRLEMGGAGALLAPGAAEALAARIEATLLARLAEEAR